jgi:hypothetical protein
VSHDVRDNTADIRRQGLDLSILGDDVDSNDRASRRRDAAILAVDKPMLDFDQRFGVELNAARAGGETGLGFSGVARVTSNVYGSAGVGLSGGTAVGRVGIGLAW